MKPLKLDGDQRHKYTIRSGRSNTMSLVLEDDGHSLRVVVNDRNRSLLGGALFLALHLPKVKKLIVDGSTILPRSLTRLMSEDGWIDIAEKQQQLSKVVRQETNQQQWVPMLSQHITSAVQKASDFFGSQIHPAGMVFRGGAPRYVVRHRNVSSRDQLSSLRQREKLLHQIDPHHRMFERVMLSSNQQQQTMRVARITPRQYLHDVLSRITGVHQASKIRPIVFGCGLVIQGLMILELFGIRCNFHIVYNPSYRNKLKIHVVDGQADFVDKMRKLIRWQLIPLLERFSSQENDRLVDKLREVIRHNMSMTDFYRNWVTHIEPMKQQQQT